MMVRNRVPEKEEPPLNLLVGGGGGGRERDRSLEYPAQKDILKKKFLKYSTNNTFLLCAICIRAKTFIFITLTA